MRRHKIAVLIVIISTLWSCTNDDRKFQKVMKLSEYKQTEFLPTLENKISTDKNSIYCVTLLYAWEEIRKNIKTQLQIDNQFYDLTLLNNSQSYKDVLNEDEYSASGKVNGDLISATAEFKKSLPFELKLSSFNNELTFDKMVLYEI